MSSRRLTSANAGNSTTNSIHPTSVQALRKLRVPNSRKAPSAGGDGFLYFNTNNKTLHVSSGVGSGAWQRVSTSGTSGVIPVSQGGTGLGFIPVNRVLIGNGSNPVTTSRFAGGTGSFVGVTGPQTISDKIINTATNPFTISTTGTPIVASGGIPGDVLTIFGGNAVWAAPSGNIGGAVSTVDRITKVSGVNTITESGVDIDATNNISGANNITAGNALQGASVSDGIAVLSGGSLTGAINITASAQIDGGSLTDGTATLTGGALSGAVSVTASGAVQGGSVTDGTATLTGGVLSGATSITASGIVQGGSVTDGIATLTGGSLSGATSITASGTVQGGTVTDGIATLTGGAITGATSVTASGTVQGGSVTDGTSTLNSGALSGATNITASGTVQGGTITDGTAALNSGALTGATSVTASGTVQGGTVTDGAATLTGGILSGATSVSATSITDGTATLTGGALSGAVSVTASGAVEGGSVTDGTATLTGGALSGATSVTASGTVEGGSVTDGTATLTGGALSGATTVTASGTVEGGTLTDGTATLTGGALSGATSVTASGAVQGGSVTDGTGTMTGGALSGITTISASGLVSLNGGATVPTGFDITLTDSPGVDTDAVNKKYVDDSISAGGAPFASADYATVAGTDDNINLGSAPATIDSVAPSNGDRILVKNGSSANNGVTSIDNGIYTFNGAGNAMTRTSDFNTLTPPPFTAGRNIFVVSGSTLNNTAWSLVNTVPMIGSPVEWTQTSGSQNLQPGTGLSQTGNTFNVGGSSTIIASATNLEVNSSAVSGVPLISSGSIGTPATFTALDLNNTSATSGTLPVSRGGTGSSSLTGNALVRANAGGTALTSMAGVTWDGSSTGNIVTTTATQTLTNKSLTSPNLTTPRINDSAGGQQYIIAVSNLTANRTVTLPLLTGNDTFVFGNHTQTLTNKTISTANNFFTISTLGNPITAAGGVAGDVFTISGGNAVWAPPAGAATSVTSTGTIADNALVRGDGGVRGVQTSGISISDTNNMTGVVNLTATSLSDGTATLTAGMLTGAVSVSATTITDTVATLTGGSLTNVTVGSAGGSATWDGTTIPVNRGGTGSTSFAANFVQGNGGGSPLTAVKTIPVGDVVGTSDTQTLTNKILNGNRIVTNSTVFANTSATANTLTLDTSGLSTTRTLTVPNVDDTIAVLNSAQTLQNKDLTNVNNDVRGDRVGDIAGTFTVSIIGANPTANQILVADGGGNMQFATFNPGNSYTRTTVNNAASPYTALTTDDIIAVDTSLGAVTIVLPLISGLPGPDQYQRYSIVDEGGNALVNNITVQPTAPDSIIGETEVVISDGYNAISVYSDGISGWFIR